MIKNYLLLLVLCSFSIANSQIISIPDANFKAKLLKADVTNEIAKDKSGKNIKIDINNDGEIQESEAVGIKNLLVDSSNISSLEGIKYFKDLQYLQCSYNKISVLDLNGINLENLFCANNSIENLDVTGLLNLKYLECSYNQLTNLDLSKQDIIKFRDFMCAGNKLTNLKIDQFINLSTVDCSDNELTSLNITAFSTLVNLNYSNNLIPNFDVRNFSKLEDFRCGNTGRVNLDLGALTGIRLLSCENNYLTNIDLSNLKLLEILICSNNKISSLDVSKFTELRSLFVENNQIPILNLENLTNLVNVYASNNLIKTLNVRNSKNVNEFVAVENPLLESVFIKNGINEYLLNVYYENPKLKYICADEEQLAQIEEYLVGSGMTDCTANSYCSFDPAGESFTIKGNNNIDINNDGCDISDIPASYFKFQITDGVKEGALVTDETGSYSISVPAGSYKITPVFENPSYYTVSPSSLQVEFPTATSPFLQNFCIAPVGIYNDLEITLLPQQPARPGFEASYVIVYKNKGNTTQSGTVKILFEDAVLNLLKASPAVSNQELNSLSWNFTDLKPFEKRLIYFVFNVNSPIETPAVNTNDILHYTASISSLQVDEKPLDNIFTFNNIVIGSYDPNDKTCLEGDVIKPELIGQYVHYLIRFENTGNYQAENIVVKDMIDLSKFDISTLVPTSASHSYVTKISDGNKVEFIFEKINLPFDDANNDGYIAFKIKTLPTLAVGDTFTNEANIYFDYNFPILTNKATSTFKTLGTQDFEFSNYFNVYPVPASNVLNVNLKSDIQIKSMAVYDVLGQLVIAVPNAGKVSTIDVSNLTTGSYFLKVMTDKGTSNTKFIKK
ncbi:T9SS type A sorting domain-containing protein [Flavobacterium sp. MC2016-06]|uniref:DUF7619 domain-containing protein n=1 Tax=Flavobacterium sp. MC2016-06 TaxID=2676308 RepID=UPI0012BB1178|nr:T9SS type A sorting domain-containing protein [Flavobacterium sp. MC2016-06]MBU3857844.1 T9SS type A sorting domain-containing protein [Flavobacterium sp. MC2016-06]